MKDGRSSFIPYPSSFGGTAVRISGDPDPANNGLFTLHSDHLGSVSAMSDENGVLVPGSLARYTPFGGWRTQPTAGLTDRGFTGHKSNNQGSGADNLGLIYMNARYYVPNTNRWIAPDSIVPNPTNPQSLNRYSYVRNNPVKYTDPTGHRECELDEMCPPPPPPQSLPWNLTDVLANEMVYHVQSPEMQAIQEGNLSIKDLRNFYGLNCPGCLYDLKETIRAQKGRMIMLCSLEKCGWFDYSTPGNIHYGYLAASANIHLEASYVAGGILETITFIEEGTHSGSLLYWGENSEDATAVRLGYMLYELFGDELTTTQLQIGIGVFWDDLQRPHPDLIMPALIVTPQEGAEAYVYYLGALEYHEPK